MTLQRLARALLDGRRRWNEQARRILCRRGKYAAPRRPCFSLVCSASGALWLLLRKAARTRVAVHSTAITSPPIRWCLHLDITITIAQYGFTFARLLQCKCPARTRAFDAQPAPPGSCALGQVQLARGNHASPPLSRRRRAPAVEQRRAPRPRVLHRRHPSDDGCDVSTFNP